MKEKDFTLGILLLSKKALISFTGRKKKSLAFFAPSIFKDFLQNPPLQLYLQNYFIKMLRAINKTSVARRTPTILKTGGKRKKKKEVDIRERRYSMILLVRAFTASTNVREEVEVFIDGKSVMIDKGAALIQACEKAGADVSLFFFFLLLLLFERLLITLL